MDGENSWPVVFYKFLLVLIIMNFIGVWIRQTQLILGKANIESYFEQKTCSYIFYFLEKSVLALD